MSPAAAHITNQCFFLFSFFFGMANRTFFVECALCTKQKATKMCCQIDIQAIKSRKWTLMRERERWNVTKKPICVRSGSVVRAFQPEKIKVNRLRIFRYFDRIGHGIGVACMRERVCVRGCANFDDFLSEKNWLIAAQSVYSFYSNKNTNIPC